MTKAQLLRIRMFACTLGLILMGLAACKPALLPGTEIEESEENRAIYDVIVTYHKGMQDRNAEAVMKTVSKDYFETAGTEDPGDDYGYEQLAQNLKDDFERSKVVRLDLHLKTIEIKDDTAVVLYRYQTRAQVSFPASEQWITKTDVNKMRLKREGETWKIVAGL
ncbi:MAG: nuclear transport factor 2 family protein [Pseudomonadota bacterium]